MNEATLPQLRYYTPGLHNVLADAVMSAFLLGSLTILSMVSTWHLIRRGVKLLSTAFMLGSVLILYASSATHFGFALAYSVAYVRLLNNAVDALTSASAIHVDSIRLGHNARTTAYILSFVLALNVTLGDALVWWRVCVLWRKKSIVALGAILITGTFVFGIISTVHWPSIQADVDFQPLMSYGDVYGGMSGTLSMITNVIATSLIGIKAWEHREVLRKGPGASRGRWSTPTMRVLMLLVESGTAYCIILGVALTNNLVSRSKWASHTASGAAFVSVTTAFLSGCFVPVLAIYPTVIIFIVAVNQSLIDNTLANATGPSKIPTDLLPSIVLRSSLSSAATTRIPPSTACHDAHRRRRSVL